MRNIIEHFRVTFFIYSLQILIVIAAFLEPNANYITANFNILTPVQPEVVVVDISRLLIRSSENYALLDNLTKRNKLAQY